jgi:hypothetical protein
MDYLGYAGARFAMLLGTEQESNRLTRLLNVSPMNLIVYLSRILCVVYCDFSLLC